MSSHTPLRGIRVLTLALNLPGPAAVMRLKAMGATCTKFEPLAGDGGSGDPMSRYRPQAYEHMHLGTKVVAADLKAPSGQKKLHALLQKTDVLITSFRPSALKKLGWTLKPWPGPTPASFRCLSWVRPAHWLKNPGTT